MSTPEIVTRAGHAGWEEHRHFGHAVFQDLAGTGYAAMLALAASGHLVSDEERAMLDALAVAITLPEPRIWPLKVTRLLSSYGRDIPGWMVGNLCFESRHIGPYTLGDTAEQLVELDRALEGRRDEAALEQECVAMLERRGRLSGFGVPFRGHDERLVALKRAVERHGRSRGRYFALAMQLGDTLRRVKKLEPNVGQGLAGTLLDMGFEPRAVPPIVCAFLQNGLLANAVEEARHPSPACRRIPASHMDYVGAAPRVSPRAQKHAP